MNVPLNNIVQSVCVCVRVKRTFVLVRVCKVAGKHANNMPIHTLFTHTIDI